MNEIYYGNHFTLNTPDAPWNDYPEDEYEGEEYDEDMEQMKHDYNE